MLIPSSSLNLGRDCPKLLKKSMNFFLIFSIYCVINASLTSSIACLYSPKLKNIHEMFFSILNCLSNWRFNNAVNSCLFLEAHQNWEQTFPNLKISVKCFSIFSIAWVINALLTPLILAYSFKLIKFEKRLP